MKKIDSFRGEYRWLSNFWPARVCFEGLWYPTVEHAYQAAKTLDPAERERIHQALEPGDAKRLGRRSVTVRPDWDSIKLSVMYVLLKQKFSLSGYRKLLLNTGDVELVEGNYWGDTFWGVCRGVGENHMGKLLMKVRNELQEGELNV